MLSLLLILLTLSNDRLYAPNDLCTFCGIDSETVNRLFCHCSGKRVHLILQDVLLRKLDAEIEIFNYFITLVKLHIWISGKRGATPLNLSVFKEIVKVKFRTEKYLAMKNNSELNFQAGWQPYIKFTLET